MRILVGVALVLAAIAPTYAEDFRGVDWGSPLAKVQKTEEAALLKAGKDFLFYKGELAGIDVRFMYKFVNDRLVEGSYLNSATHTNRNDFISDFKKLKELLTKKYGAPKVDDTVWRNDLYKDDPAQWGFAVSLGHLAYLASWETDRTTIKPLLHGDNYKISHGIIYTERASESKIKEDKEKQTLDKL